MAENNKPYIQLNFFNLYEPLPPRQRFFLFMESSINSFQDGKVMLTLAEAASYMSLSKSYLYKLVCWGEIAHYKPGGKRVYFHIDDVVAWLQRNRIPSRDELERRAECYVSQSKIK